MPSLILRPVVFACFEFLFDRPELSCLDARETAVRVHIDICYPELISAGVFGALWCAAVNSGWSC